jgi:ribulose-phosphate 3-epimerase
VTAATGDVLMNASMMCADPMHLGHEVHALVEAGIDMFHCDVMDGVFVPNITLGLYQIEALAKSSTVPIEVHLMVSKPEDYIETLADFGVAVITVHAESTRHLSRLLHSIKKRGIRVGLSLNPATPVTSVKDVMHLVDLLQIMTVDPGFAGQAFLTRSNERVAEARIMLEELGLTEVTIQVDGSINTATIPDVVANGAKSLVLGSSSLFGVGTDHYEKQIIELRKVAGHREIT